MAYEIKPLTGSLFINTDKKEDWQPEHKGQLKSGDGKEYWFNGFEKTEGKKSFLFLTVQEKGTKFTKKANGDKTDSGILEKNKKKENEKQADHKGKINIAGKEFWISGWDNTSQNGGKQYIKIILKSVEEAASGTQPQNESNWEKPPESGQSVGWSEIGVPPDFE
jgi:hypothetical protein